MARDCSHRYSRRQGVRLALALALPVGVLSLMLAWTLASMSGAHTQDLPARGSADVEELAVPDYPGLLDESFGSGGIVTTTFASGSAQGRAVALQPDGRIVVAGHAGGGNSDLALARYDASGKLDQAFGSAGMVTTDLGARDEAVAVVLQPDGKIVVAGYTGAAGSDDIALARYTVSGTLDTSFGSGGVVTASLGANQRAYAVALDGDRIVVAGDSGHGTDWDLALLRYTTSGSLDATFGAGGVVTTSVSSAGDHCRDVAVQPDGKILVVGHVGYSIGTDDILLARYTVSGTLDVTFGNGGIVITTVGNGDAYAEAVHIRPDGSILVAGHSQNGLDDFTLLCYTVSGTPDVSFGASGVVTTDFGDDDEAHALDVQGNGRIVVAGDNSEVCPAIARYHPDGSLDTSFGTNGLANTHVGSGGKGYAVAVQPNGRIVLAGYGGQSYFALVRYRPHLVYMPYVHRTHDPSWWITE